MRRRRTVLMECGAWRSGRIGGAARLETFGWRRCREPLAGDAAPRGAAEPAKYWLSNLPPRTALKDLVHTAKARWLIERDYQELKQEIGLGHYEGRGWRGFHHHASLCIAAYGFLVAERCLSPPQARFTRRRLTPPALPEGFRPRGAGPA